MTCGVGAYLPVAAPTKYIARSFQGQINIEPGQSSTLAANELAPLTGRKATLSEVAPFAVLPSKVCICNGARRFKV